VSSIADHIQTVQNQIAAAAARSGRTVGDITLIAVSKTVPPTGIEDALAAGLTIFGESRVQEAKAKIPQLPGRARWHMLGHLQSNKARDAVQMFELIHSVDSVKLAAELNKWAEHAGKTQSVLLEVNVSGEVSKFGLKPDAVPAALTEINRLTRIEVCGLMTIAPYLEDAQLVRPYFRQLRELRDRLSLRELSMGMTHDFEAAIEEGATMVRVGTAIFGERHYEPTE
jgi:PLP dependent protein